MGRARIKTLACGEHKMPPHWNAETRLLISVNECDIVVEAYVPT
jgi:hypothetical protein